MSYEQFAEFVVKQLGEQLTGRNRVRLGSAVKNNGRIRTGIVFIETDSNVSPTIYLEEYYERYRDGATAEQIVGQIMCLYDRIRVQRIMDLEEICNYAKIRGRIVYRLINREKNTELLKETPGRDFLDLSVVFCVLMKLDRGGGNMTSMLIRREHLKWWQVTEEELFRTACENTKRLLPAEFKPMSEVVGAEDGTKDDLYVLTNTGKNFGAASLLYEGQLEAAGRFFGQDFYVLPSSIHEVILLPVSDALPYRELCAIVEEMNETQVQKDEVLSNYVYYYDRQNEKLKYPGGEVSVAGFVYEGGRNEKESK